ncbi:MAG TPA: hypothetical protein VLX92_12650 [Kofleriaceae bacterium]|nr:hypothetical protein [Kofleriaceae bacterium]
MATAPDWDQRLLCSDGACIGVIGDDGTCKVCGRAAANWGEERRRGLADGEEQPEDEDEHEADEADEADEAEDRPAAEAAAPAEWEDRKLCSNGACIGVIGEDGRCTVCGSPP